MADLTNQELTASKIADHAAASTVPGQKDESEAVATLDLVRANPAAAKTAIQELQKNGSRFEGDSGRMGADAQKAVAEIQKDLRISHSEPTITNQELTASKIADHAVASTVPGQKDESEAVATLDLVRANPAAAKAAIQELQKNGSRFEGDSGRMGADAKKAVAEIQKDLNEIGVGASKDVQAHDVRHDAATVARTKQLGG